MLVLAWLTSGTDALTIYRIGGASLPRPELAAGVEFVQLDWGEVEAAQHGRVESLKIDANGPQLISLYKPECVVQ